MGSMNIFADCGFFCTIWIMSFAFWEATGLILVGLLAAGLLWKSMKFRKRVLDVLGVLLVLHVGNTLYFKWFMGY